jgi:hypothetical protein
LLLSAEAQVARRTTETVIRDIVASVPVPTPRPRAGEGRRRD